PKFGREQSCLYNERSSLRPGWRRSADRTRLYANFLVAGSFTGNSAVLGVLERIFNSRKPLYCSRFSNSSLVKLTGKLFQRSGNLLAITGIFRTNRGLRKMATDVFARSPLGS